MIFSVLYVSQKVMALLNVVRPGNQIQKQCSVNYTKPCCPK